MKCILKNLMLILAILTLGYFQVSEASVSLAGDWKCVLDSEDKGEKEQWFLSPLPGDAKVIKLPGSLQEQGMGNDVSMTTQWTGGRKVSGTAEESPVYEKYKTEGNVKVPSWLNPVKHYVGVAWYQREVEIPPFGANLEHVLELERTHWETTAYLDGKKLGTCNSLSAPHRYDLSGLTAGKHLLTVRVDNRVKIPVGNDAHSVSDHTQSNWNGIIGQMEIISQPTSVMEDVQIYPQVKEKSILVRISGKKAPGVKKSKLTLQVENKNNSLVGEPLEVETQGLGETFQIEKTLPMGNSSVLWSEHTPHLYRFRATFVNDEEKQDKVISFGMREIKAKGTRFYVNDRPIFLRGTLESCIFPLTGYPSMDASYWEKIYKTCKAHGLNHVRFHSWCPPKVAFEVADKMGIYLQAECAAWGSIGDGGTQDQWIREEGDRILKEYGNHPSFCLMTYGNEPSGQNHVKYLADLVADWKARDVRRVYTGAAGWPYLEKADYWNAPDPRIQGWGQGLRSIINAEPGRFDYDFAKIIKPNMPTVSHEIGQWCVYPNYKEIGKYKGVLKAKNLELFQEVLESRGMKDLAGSFLYASGRLQTLCYKADIEAALRTPGFAGFQLLDLHDFPGQGTALVGVLDPFWESKGYVTPEEYRTFCNDTVPLARFPKMVWTNDQVLEVPLEIAHFGKEEKKGAVIDWKIMTENNVVLAKGNFICDLTFANGIPVGNIKYPLEAVTSPSHLKLAVSVRDSNYRNQWSFWVYPAEKSAVSKMPYVAKAFDNTVREKLEKGENVLLALPNGTVAPEKGGKIAVGFSSIFWNTAWTNKQAPHVLGVYCSAKHPALASFPNQGYSDYQWWDIVTYSNAMILDDFPADLRPIVHLIDDWFTNRKLGILFEAKVGKGKLMVSSVDFEKDIEKRPATQQFKQSILEYMASDNFSPKEKVAPELIEKLFVSAQK